MKIHIDLYDLPLEKRTRIHEKGNLMEGCLKSLFSF